ncbi:MAG TPA: MBL fold metallo-hydrolase [Gaiellaceae bacterium]|nr:MBL fold metallo-hydrolase [Gaiellaceae bacterium]
MHLRIVGSSPAWPNPGSACSGHLVDGRLLLDCGPGVLAKLRELEPWPTVEAIAISHLHLDHWGDLVPWVWGSLFGAGAGLPRPRLLLPPGSVDELRPLLGKLGNERMLERVFDVEEFAAGVALDVAGLRLTPHRVVHYDLDAYGFRVEDGAAALAYSGDSGPCSSLVELARDADLLLCEATLDDPDEGDERGHLTPAEAREVQERAEARRLVLVHRPHERAPLDGYELARDGLELEL